MTKKLKNFMTAGEVRADLLKDPGVRNSCLGRAYENEPVFILRGQDTFAAVIVELWAGLVRNASGGETPKVLGAMEVVKAMQNWQSTHGAKLPD